MKLKFKHQSYQDNAVQAIVDVFKGQSKGYRRDLLARYKKTEGTGIFREEKEIEEISFGNKSIELLETQERNNIRTIQRRNDINLTDGQDLSEFSIEMETGTGKTFTYIKTMYELNKEYGWSKFIVMVPSIAIREGVQKSFDVTQDYFQELYHKKIRYFIYNSSNSSNIANINAFASDDSIQVMIINYQAFTSKGAGNRKIYEELDELQSRRPIDVIKSVHPILIIDEPQKFGDKTEELFKEFNPLFKIRYSATHKRGKEYNKVYRLDAIDAYNQKLVKKINVKGIEVLHDKSEDTYLFLDSVDISNKHDPIANLEIEVKSSSGVSRKLMKIKAGDDLYTKSGELQQYKGYKISEIDGRYEDYDKVYFTNGKMIQEGQAKGNVEQEYISRIQIRETIKTHLEKEKELYKKGIKVLSLFFIDEVAKYKYYEDSQALKGEYAKIFEEEYNKAITDYINIFDDEYSKYLKSFKTGKIHAGYFSIDKKGHEIDSAINDKKEYLSFDEDAYDLIMKDKERLLSLEEPVRFIFSHSALREGWDNPNIFQICTLKHSNSEISKRQEIGRGLRICVNNNGERMDYSVLEDNFHLINNLTVIASESYDKFAEALQTEMIDSLSSRPTKLTMDWLLNKQAINEEGNILEFNNENTFNFMLQMKNAGYVDEQFKITERFIEDRDNNELNLGDPFNSFKEDITRMISNIYNTDNYKPITDGRRDNIKNLIPNDNFNKKEFQDLWNKINIKTLYEVDFDSDELIEKAVNSIDAKLNIAKMAIRITQGEQKETLSAESLKEHSTLTNGKTSTILLDDFSPSQVEYDLIGEITKDTGLTRKTIVIILSKINPEKFNYYQYNPEEFIRKVTNIINDEKATSVIEGITYHKTDKKYSTDIFTMNNIKAELNVNAISNVKKHIYDFLVYDSLIEKKFAEKLESGEVTVYAKLPNDFKIPTPVGNYNPDWAIVFDNKSFKYIYFIAETKGDMSSLQLKGAEQAKIACAKKHFECISNGEVKYDVVDSYESLINMIS